MRGVPTIVDMKTTAGGELEAGGLREFLQRELARRCAANPQYSLRAFAKALGTDHSTLSQILRRKRRLTAEAVRGLAAAAGLTANEIERFITYEERLGGAAPPEWHVRQLQAEAVEIITGWQHFAILELTRLECFRPDSRWIARVLDLAVDEVNMALVRLLHLGLLQMVDAERWVDTSTHAEARFDHLPSGLLRELAERVARFAQADRAGERVVSSSTLAIDRKRLPMAASYLERVRQELVQLVAGDHHSCDDVYQLDVLLYPLTNLQEVSSHGPTGDAVSDSGKEPSSGS